ncbi:hypothetical protein Gohar_016958 [Gossypium harknessii]|uniref:Uncharacterized protein n=1 Tax=Gossypium harknessii TaxID=34285 RepID=A0A7J9G4S3_9ROSI|nr:hypothetical protein [Gossypium harknessii]
MEAPITTMKAKSHARSNSLPSESHPVVADVEDKLRLLRALEATSSSPSSLLDDMLDGSLKLLDTCSSSKDALSQIKGCVRGFESSLRRKIRCKSSLVNEIREYFISRKQVNKIVCNCFGNMKRMQKSNATLVESDDDLVALASMVNEVEAVSLTVFKSLLSFLYSPKSKPAGKKESIDVTVTQVQMTLKNLKAF